MTLRLLIFITTIVFSNLSISETNSYSSSCLEELNNVSELKNIISNRDSEIKKLSSAKSKQDVDSLEYDKFQRDSLTLFNQGKYTKGLNSAFKALLLALSSASDYKEPYKAIAYSRAGINLYKLGYLDASIACHKDAYNIFKEDVQKDPKRLFASDLAWEGINLGRNLSFVGDYENSSKLINKSMLEFKSLSNNSLEDKDKYVDYFLNALAEKTEISIKTGYLDLAKKTMEMYLKVYSSAKYVKPVYEAYAREVFGRLLLEINQFEKAKTQVLLGKSVISNLPNYYLHPKLDSLLAEILFANDELEKAFKFSSRGVNLISDSRKKGDNTFSKINEKETKTASIYGTHFLLAHAINSRETFSTLQQIDQENFSNRMEQIIDSNGRSRIDSKVNRTLEEYNLKSKDCSAKKIAWEHSYQLDTLETFETKRGQLKKCEIKRDELSRYVDDDKKIKAFLRPEILDINSLKEILDKNEALIAFYFTSDNVFSWLITKENENFIKLDINNKKISELVNRIKKTMTADSPRNLRPFDKNAASDLYKVLIRPHEKNLTGIQSLIFVKNELLGAIPMQMLIDENTPEKEWLFQRYNISTVFMPANLKVKKTSNNYLNSFFGFGDPAAIERMPSIPNSGEELIALGMAFKNSPSSNIFLKDRLTIENLKKNQSEIGTLAFATHAIKPGEIDGQGDHSLLLDRWLGANEIAFDLEIRAKLVLLSACNTAWSSRSNERAILDLPSAFLLSGADAVIVAKWNISDESTKDIILSAAKYIYLNRNENNLISKALRKGMNDYISSNKDEVFTAGRNRISKAHPYFWAPFELIGSQ